MRRLSTPICLFGLLIATPALAQDVKPEDVKLDEAPAAAPAAPAPAAAAPAAPAAHATATATVDANAATAEKKDEKKEDTRAATGSVSGPVTEGDDTWKFGYNGYFRAPMRIGMGSRPSGTGGPSGMSLHAPLVPDEQYLSWQHTKHSNTDWAELFFSYGNSWAKGVVAVQGYNFTDASYANWHTQFGVGQGWIEITPYMPAENIRFKLKAGSFWNRYGGMGRYDAGEYDTFLFGRTHLMGETARLEIDLDGQPITIGIEQGFGTKKPDPSIYNGARFTVVPHFHADVTYDQAITFSAHFIDAIAMSEPTMTGPQPNWVAPGGYVQNYQGANQPDGSLKVMGLDARFDMPEVFGYLYAGVSYISAKNAVTVAPGVEVIHSDGGGEYNMGITGNYLNSSECTWGFTKACSNGNGGVLTLSGQYEAKLGDLLGGSPFGDGQDLTMKFYGMWNKVKSDDKIADGVSKTKFGTDMIFDVFPVMSVATRFDYLMPNSRYAKQNFGILSPRIILRSSFVTHEQIAFQYSRFIYSQRACASGTPANNYSYAGGADATSQVASPYFGATSPYFGAPTADAVNCVQPPPSLSTPESWGQTTQSQDALLRGQPVTSSQLRPDVNVFSIEASMWW